MIAFIKKEGHARPTDKYKSEDGYLLGSWVANQRTGKDRMSAERKSRLDALPGWVWDINEHKWEEGYSHLQAFVEREGHARPPVGYRSPDGYALGKWVSRQRQAREAMPPDRKARLEALLGWVWKFG